MSKFLKSTPFETTFDGDQVKCRLKAVEQADSLRILALKNAEGKLMRADAMPVFAEILPKYVEEFAGLRDASGAAIDMADVMRNTYFSELLIELGTALIKTGNPPDPKAHASPPGATSAA